MQELPKDGQQNEQLRRDESAPSLSQQRNQIDIESALSQISAFPLSDLRAMRYQIGAVLHQDLLAMKQDGVIEGVAIADGACPGMVGDVLASCDGSSKYLRFSLNLNNLDAQRAVGATGSFDSLDFANHQLRYLREFSNQHELASDYVLGVNGWVSGSRAGRFTITSGEEISECTVQLSSDGGLQDRQRLRECAAISTLFTIANQISRAGYNRAQQSALSAVHEGVLETVNDSHGFVETTETLRLVSEGQWAEMFDIFKMYEAQPLAVGESFTFGKIGRLLSSLPGSSEQVAFLYGWYHPDAKQVFGVDPSRLSDENIAEPETVLQGARGLLQNGYGSPGLSIGTSGWANNGWLKDPATGQVNDFFSVAAAAQIGDGFRTRALRVSLPQTQDLSTSPERRNFTRELGVVAGLASLGGVVRVGEARADRAVREITRHLRATLDRHAIVQESELP